MTPVFSLLTLVAIDPFLTAAGGISALSGDAGTSFTGSPVASLYKPENGPAASVGAGTHFNNWMSAQLSYVWNRNAIELQGIRGESFFAWPQTMSQHALVGDAMLYFRPRRSRLRPYLSAGIAAIRFDRDSAGALRQSGAFVLPATPQTSWRPGMRVAVGIDILFSRGWGFRYSFSETLSKNPVSGALTPPAPRNLMNFQNLFGVVKYFR
ncbi:MAG: outer membrane beta-barrel protein [Bryobacteraceae bacterium]|nr:outer membrane beta-barrel protein [Bryobacteraceae bacterium]